MKTVFRILAFISWVCLIIFIGVYGLNLLFGNLEVVEQWTIYTIIAHLIVGGVLLGAALIFRKLSRR